MSGRRYSRAQWQELFAEQEQSGLPVSKFCRSKDASEASFYHWRKKLAAGERQVGQTAKEQSDSPFVPVVVTGTSDVEIALPCGATLRVPHNGPGLAHVLKALFEIGTPV